MGMGNVSLENLTKKERNKKFKNNNTVKIKATL